MSAMDVDTDVSCSMETLDAGASGEAARAQAESRCPWRWSASARQEVAPPSPQSMATSPRDSPSTPSHGSSTKATSEVPESSWAEYRPKRVEATSAEPPLGRSLQASPCAWTRLWGQCTSSILAPASCPPWVVVPACCKNTASLWPDSPPAACSLPDLEASEALSTPSSRSSGETLKTSMPKEPSSTNTPANHQRQMSSTVAAQKMRHGTKPGLTCACASDALSSSPFSLSFSRGTKVVGSKSWRWKPSPSCADVAPGRRSGRWGTGQPCSSYLTDCTAGPQPGTLASGYRSADVWAGESVWVCLWSSRFLIQPNTSMYMTERKPVGSSAPPFCSLTLLMYSRKVSHMACTR
mmetsp:Transcript_89537/g.233380  ORF Transcript_89537/g.233380 Transcript_89537/m.233380 type:complete len:352 (-) Transcript_89537:1110-2165(-)